MIVTFAKRMLTTVDSRLLWKFALNFGLKGALSVERYKSRLKRGIHFPPFLFISVINSCNLRCQGCWVDVAAILPGDITVIDSTPERPLAVTRGAWLANEQSLTMDTKWGGANNLFGGEGGFVSRFDGAGKVVVASYGALDQHALHEGERLVVDSGHLVAYDAYIAMQARTTGGIMKSLKSGEGIVVEITGPGLVWTQSRNPNGLVTWLTAVLPFSRS